MSIVKTELNIGSYFVYQDTDDYAFSADSVLLANLAQISASDCVLDLGSGSGIIAMLLSIKKHAKSIVGIEINASACALASRSAAENDLSDKIKFICGDVKNITDFVGFEQFDKVVCNPPYFEKIENCNNSRASDLILSSFSPRGCARTESTAKLYDFVTAAKKTLKFGGELTIVQKHNRLCDLICALRENNLEPKHITYIRTVENREIDTVIICARKGAKCGLTSDTIVIQNTDGSYTEKFKELYR